MFDPKKHILHLADGKLQTDSTYADVQAMVHDAIHSKKRPNGIVLHFHGGLVSQDRARESAKRRLYPLYAQRAKTYPIFFVWESGPVDAPLNNFGEIIPEILKEIGQENLFREFVKKTAEWVLKKLPSNSGIKGAAGTTINEAQLRKEFDAWFSQQKPTPPDALATEAGVTNDSIAKNTRARALDEQALLDEIEESIDGDDDFKRSVEQVFNGLHTSGQTATSTRGAGTSVSVTSLISKEAADRLFPLQDDAPDEVRIRGFGPIEWVSIAKAVVEIVIRVIERVSKGRAHGLNGPQGLYVTLVEEVLRALYIDKIGRIGWWDRMKTDTSDAFRKGQEYGGTVLLSELNRQLEGLPDQPTITLVGHSAGAIYVCNFLTAAAVFAPTLRFNVIFEAPAASHALMAATVAAHGSRIANFRQFGMSDAREAIDTIVPVVYLSSLLYFVSGLLEQEPDEPLIGMERYWVEPVYNAASFPNIETCRKFYNKYPNSLNWSPSVKGEGLNTNGHHHGDFGDTDPETMASVEYILKNGFDAKRFV